MINRILVVDKDIRWLDYVRSDLNKFEIVIAQDTETILSELRSSVFDLVIAGSNYIPVIKTALGEYPNQRFIIATVQPSTQEALNVYRFGAIGYYSKSFRPQGLFNYVTEVIFTEQ